MSNHDSPEEAELAALALIEAEQRRDFEAMAAILDPMEGDELRGFAHCLAALLAMALSPEAIAGIRSDILEGKEGKGDDSAS